ncbi:hypothetical protein [Sulfitobacter sp. R18_1]|uniref:hypothetical protein n=1 Tax=Sulfitobacter sp. R18_1 TaxID=2821104 RepID=UPI001ADCF7E9|nr:hypothetical protein [Sulfitobacter sp. R18_1]MBO9428052.1 hypothetical protein [Sulfitobacter sp. R18_1]
MSEQDNCEGCGTERVLAPGIDYYCPNKECSYERDQMFARIAQNRAQAQSDEKVKGYTVAEAIRGVAFRDAADLVDEIASRQGDLIEKDEEGRIYVRLEVVYRELMERSGLEDVLR